MLRFLGLGPGPAAAAAAESAKPEPARSLPASWYRSPEMYELERRAVFSRQWMLVTHAMRFARAGDYQTHTLAGFPVVLVRGRERERRREEEEGDGGAVPIRGFHNACRHRAYPVVAAARSGNAAAGVLSCRYHGWSYGLGGGLAKAPRFDAVPGFDRAQHGLLPVHVHVDRAGFVWVNLQSGARPPVRWEEDALAGVDYAAEFAYDHTWDMEVAANWKGLVDNYNECYHCATAHPLIARVSDLARYRVEPGKGGSLEHEIVNKEQRGEDDEFRRSITFFPPTTSVTITDNFFYIQRMIPVTATTSIIENEVYRHKNATDEEFANINAFYRQVLAEDKELCEGAQRNLDARVYINGELHPEKEKGPIHFQNAVRKGVMEHRRREEELGREIWPAAPEITGEMKTEKLEEEEDFCSRLEASSCAAKREQLAW
ncbi:Rieske domain-containing protein [Biscogniauxia mediterranea]|nr:Rieske domain-containing protein [Biscogniauxia mediterranea]